MTCRRCGAEIRTGKRFCGECGAPVPPPAPLVVPSSATCPQCGATLKAGAQFCGHCGLRIPAQPRAAICHACNAPLIADARFCGSCGAAVRVAAEKVTPKAEKTTPKWELPPWPLGLTPPPPPLGGAIHRFSMVGKALSRMSPVKIDHPPPHDRPCPNCQRVVGAGKKFCPECGSRLTAASI
jgi:predicted amidophosphoribosyltransferase